MIRVREALRCAAPTAQLFATPTIAGLGEAMARAGTGEGAAARIPAAGYSAQALAAGVPCSLNQEQARSPDRDHAKELIASGLHHLKVSQRSGS